MANKEIHEFSAVSDLDDNSVFVAQIPDGTNFLTRSVLWSSVKTLLSAVFQPLLAEGGFIDGDKSKLDGIADGAEVTPDLIPQAEAEAGTATTERVISAERLKQAIDALAITQGDPLTDLSSGTATDGQIPAADGAGGIAWKDESGGGLTYVTKTITTANLTLVEGEAHLVDISGMTADMDIILPTPSAAGKECEIVLTTDAPADYEAVVKVGGVELTRLFISDEKIKFVSTGTAAGDWIVIDDGRIPCYATLYLSVDQTGVATTITTQVELDSILSQRGGIADLTNNKIVGRRAGTYNVSGSVTYTTITGTYIWSEILVSAKRVRCLSQASGSRLPLPIPTACIEIDAGDDFILNTQHNAGSDQILDGAGQLITFMTVKEILL